MENERGSWQSVCVAENEKKSDGRYFFCANRRVGMFCPGSFVNHSRSIFAEVIQKLWWPLLYQWRFGGKFKIKLPFAQKQPKKHSQKHRSCFVYIHSEVSTFVFYSSPKKNMNSKFGVILMNINDINICALKFVTFLLNTTSFPLRSLSNHKLKIWKNLLP